MKGPKVVDIYDKSYNEVTITIQKRTMYGQLPDYGYKTSNGIKGIGQSSPQEAETDAKRAIDQLLDRKAGT